MNFFRKKYQKKLRFVWGIISVLVIISMVALYAGFLAGSGGGQAVPAYEPDTADPTPIATPEISEQESVTEDLPDETAL
ncbi:MAG: hypothetical protein ACI83D_000413 [Planctomycetota bacterium]|jgi:hypothetical protein